MSEITHRIAAALLNRTGLCYWPVRVRGGLAAGARWTLFPWSAYWRGGFEPELQSELIALGDITGWSCWDLGAHYGLYSVGLARRTGPTGQVASFEPNPLSFRRLVRHGRMNRLSWLKPFEVAVSDADGQAEFYTYGQLESTTTHLAYEGEKRSADCAPLKVRLVRLDDLVARGEIRPPQLIKVDVEGHAHKALAGARQAIAASRPIVIVALHSEDEARGVRQILEPLGYVSRLIATHSGSSHAEIGHDLIFRPAPR
ncbi:MAG: FkbM family methyltransferase [Opitutales bacterium]